MRWRTPQNVKAQDADASIGAGTGARVAFVWRTEGGGRAY